MALLVFAHLLDAGKHAFCPIALPLLPSAIAEVITMSISFVAGSDKLGKNKGKRMEMAMACDGHYNSDLAEFYKKS